MVDVDSAYPLSPAQVRGFREDGFIKLPEVFSAETLARCGNAGLRQLKQQWSANKSRPTVRRAIVRGWARSENPNALKHILDPGLWDKNRSVSEAAIKGCANFTQVKVGTRKKTLQKLIERYKRVTDAAAGKP